MANLNKIILIGRLTEDPEVRYTMEGIPMAKFTLVVDRIGKGTDFIPIIAWRRLAEICGEYLKKGKLVLVDGRIQIRSFLTPTGSKRWQTEVVARNMQMLDKNKSAVIPQTPVQEAEISEEF